METSNKAQQALERLRQSQETWSDLETLRRALRRGQIALARGDRAVAFGGDVTDTVVVTGDQNVVAVFKEADTYALQVLARLNARSAWSQLAVGLAGIAVLAIVAFAVLVWLGIVDLPSRAVVAVGEAALLYSPDSQSRAVAQLNEGQQVEVLGQISETTWLYVETDQGARGWVRKGDLKNVPKSIPRAANPATATPMPTPTQPPTLTLTPSPVPEVAQVYYILILDASSRMTDSFAGSDTKWTSARKSALDLLTVGLPPGANYGLIVLGGNQLGSTQTCDDPNRMLVSLASRQQQAVINEIESLEPQGVASLTSALALARDQLGKLPAGLEKTIIVITGGGDSCCPDDMWESLLDLLRLSFSSINAYTELIILADEEVDEEVLAVVQEITQLGLENVRADAPTDQEKLEDTIEEVASSAVERSREKMESVAIAEEETVETDDVVAVVPTPIPSVTPTIEKPEAPPAGATVPAPSPTVSPPTATLPPTATTTDMPPPPTPPITSTPTPTTTSTPTPPITSTPTPTATPTPTPTATSTPVFPLEITGIICRPADDPDVLHGYKVFVPDRHFEKFGYEQSGFDVTVINPQSGNHITAEVFAFRDFQSMQQWDDCDYALKQSMRLDLGGDLNDVANIEPMESRPTRTLIFDQ
jgi:hypothetical protein